jgi:hypothetical protein
MLEDQIVVMRISAGDLNEMQQNNKPQSKSIICASKIWT